MFKTKKDVDRHVRANLAKLNDLEKKYRGFTIAKLYFKINEFTTAANYVSDYLSVCKEKASAYKLLGQCMLKLNKMDKALESFQRSLQLDVKQPDILTEVCKMLVLKDSLDECNAEYWCKLAELENIQDNSVFNLRLKLSEKDKMKSELIEDRILNEISNNPTEISLRIHYTQYLIKQNKFREAFTYAFNLEINSREILNFSIEWYDTLSVLMTKLKTLLNVQKDWKYLLLQTICFEKQLYLSFNLDESLTNKSLSKIEVFCVNFDQHLNQMLQFIKGVCTEQIKTEFFKHFRGQLCLNFSSILLKKELIENNNWKETMKKVIPLLLLAYQNEPLNMQQQWVKNLDEEDKQLVNLWNNEGNFRCIQAGRTILSCASNTIESTFNERLDIEVFRNFESINSNDFLNEIQEYCLNKNWRTKIYQEIFGNANITSDVSLSYFINCEELSNPILRLPPKCELENYEESAQKWKPQSLQHMTYLLINTDYSIKKLNFLQGKHFWTNNVTCGGSESLSMLDMELFLYASAIQAKRSLELNMNYLETFHLKNSWRPVILPFVNIQTVLCTEAQLNWWKLAYNEYNGITDAKSAELRATLKYGIEAVRGGNEQKMDLIIILKLAKILTQRCKMVTITVEKNEIESRAICLYKHGLQILKKGNKESGQMLFSYPVGNRSSIEEDLNLLIDEAIQYVAGNYFQKSKYKEFIDLITGIKQSLATYYLVEAYKNLEGKKDEVGRNNYLKNSRQTENHIVDFNKSGIRYLNLTSKENEVFSAENLQTNGNNTKFVDSEMNLSRSNDLNNQEKAQIRQDYFVENAEDLIKEIKETLSFLKAEVVNFVRPEVKELRKDIADLKDKIIILENKLNADKPEAVRSAALNDYLVAANMQNELYPTQQSQQIIPLQNIEDLQAKQQIQDQVLNTNKSPLFNSNYMGMNNFPLYTAPSQTLRPFHNPSFQRLNQMNPAWVLANPHIPYDSFNNKIPTVTQNSGLEPEKLKDFLNLYQSGGMFSNQPKPSTIINVPLGPDMQQTVPCSQTLNPNIWNECLFNNMSVEKLYLESAEIGRLPSNLIPNSALLSATTTLNNPVAPLLSSPFTFSPSMPRTIAATFTTSSPLFGTGTITSNINMSANQFLDVQRPVVIGTNLDNTIQNVSQGSIEVSNRSDIEYDPRPDFQPIIPLPAEVKVNTGEENEEVLFSSKAKLFRFVNKEWKERGYGDLKILKSREDGKARVLMRRDLTHKICANHKITGEMNLIQPSSKKEENCYIWAANDYADEELQVEKFCVRFKLVETAREFYKVFMQAKTDSEKEERESALNLENQHSNKPATSAAEQISASLKHPNFDESLKNLNGNGNLNLGSGNLNLDPFKNLNLGNAFSSTTKPFEALISSFGKTSAENVLNFSDKEFINPKANESSSIEETINKVAQGTEDDFVPTAEFLPVIELPDLVEVQTGEENENIIFEHRAKLLRFDKQSSEWKERGLGNIKILQDRINHNKIRLLMRREKIQKLCCNQNLLKETKFIFPKNVKTKNSLMWTGSDFSENELVIETFLLKFKTEEICTNFLDNVLKLQAAMTEAELKSCEKEIGNNNLMNAKGFGEKFKPKEGSWSCKACYLQNSSDALFCIACKTPKNGTADNIFQSSIAAKGFGDKFLPKEGSWSCQDCYTQNSCDSLKCVACSALKDGKKVNVVKEIISQSATASNSFGDKFKPKEGSWSCNECYVQNLSDNLNCVACNASKDGKIDNSLKENIFQSPFSTFSFGFNNGKNPIGGDSTKFSFGFNIPTTTTTNTFEFNSQPNSNNNFFSLNKTNTINQETSVSAAIQTTTPFTNINSGNSSKSNSEFQAASIVPKQPIAFSFLEKQPEMIFKSSTDDDNFNFGKKEFIFNFDKKSPGKIKSPIKLSISKDDTEASGDEFEEEENNVYFSPVVHLQKVDVKTGEEDEEVLYCHRAKLFRFSDKEWKERGLGEIKILRHKFDPDKLRVIMRREQIHKICLNHLLTPEIDYKRKDSKSWLFAVNDFSEGEIETMQFCIRFKTKEIAENFMEEIENALSTHSAYNKIKGDQNISTDEQTMENLLLPKDFFLQEEKCIGCRGCDPDTFVFEEIKESEVFLENNEKPLPLSLINSALMPSKEKNSLLKQSLFSLPPAQETNQNKLFTDNIFSKGNKEEHKTFEPFSKLQSDSSIFNNKPFSPVPVFGGFPFAASINDNKSTEVGNAKGENLSIKSNLLSNDDNANNNLFKTNSVNLVDFASLAKSAKENVLQKSNEAQAGEYFGLIHQDSFSNFTKSKFGNNLQSSNSNDNGNDISGEDHCFDPYYKPIIELPKEIAVSTGEENETKLFGERATLFRYDSTNKEWKERGVGEIKILHHPQQGTYRLLLRREQIHKLVLNHVINQDFIINNMNNSAKAFCWGAVNYAEEQPQTEKLAIRFKNADLGKKFQDTINTCLTQLKN